MLALWYIISLWYHICCQLYFFLFIFSIFLILHYVVSYMHIYFTNIWRNQCIFLFFSFFPYIIFICTPHIYQGGPYHHRNHTLMATLSKGPLHILWIFDEINVVFINLLPILCLYVCHIFINKTHVLIRVLLEGLLFVETW